DAYNTKLQEENDPIKGAANMGRIGVDIISGGSLSALRGAKAAAGASKGLSLSSKGMKTGRLAKGADDAAMSTKARMLRQGAAGAVLEGAYSPVQQYADDREINLRDTAEAAAFGGVL